MSRGWNGALVVALLLVWAAVAADECQNPTISPNGPVPHENINDHVLQLEEPQPSADPDATLPTQDAFMLSMCHKTVKTPKWGVGTKCGVTKYYAARWNGTNCVDVYDNPVAKTYPVKQHKIDVEFTSMNNSAHKLIISYDCSVTGQKFDRTGTVITWTLGTTKSPLCPPPTVAPNPTPQPFPGDNPEPPGDNPEPPGDSPEPPGPDGNNNNDNHGSNNNNFNQHADDDDGLSAIVIFLIVLGVGAVVVLVFVVIDLKRKNSMLHRIAAGPEHDDHHPEGGMGDVGYGDGDVKN